MIDYNINFYRPAYASSYIVNGDTLPVAHTIGDIWAYYSSVDPANADYQGKPLDDTINIWHVAKDSSIGTNVCVSIAPSGNLNFEVKENQNFNDVPFAMCLYAQNFNGGFRVDPSIRLGYDITKPDVNYGGWRKACLIYDINPLEWCLYPTIAVYSYDTHTIGTFRTLENLISYLNADNTRRVTTLRNYLYRGTDTRTSSSEYWMDGSDSVYIDPVAAPLTDRPICDNLLNTVQAYIADSPNDYKSDAVYNPFNQAQTTWLFSSDIFGASRQLDIGFAIQIASNSLISGRYPVPDSHGRCTACFAHLNTSNKVFDDVAYHWRTCVYDEALDRELPNGHDISSFSPAHNCRVMSVLEIDDYGNYNTYGEAVKAAVLHELAYIGYYFAESTAKAISDPLGTASTGQGIYLPEKIGGVTTGRYFTGEQIKDVPYANATDTTPFIYRPDLVPGEETGDNTSIINSGTIGSGATYYALTNAEMNDLSTWLNTTYAPTDQDTFIQDFKGMNPADYITACVYYPFDIPIVSAGQPIVVGKLTAGGATGAKLNYTYGQLWDYGSYDIPRLGNWLDYLTQVTVFVPFCGTVKLDPILWVDHTLNVKMAIDWPTGACTAFLFRDGGLFDSISGTVGVPLPLSAVANGSYQVAITNLLASHKAAHRSMIAGALGVAGGAMGAIGGTFATNPKLAIGGLLSMASGGMAIDAGADKMENVEYNIDHTQPSVSEVSGGTPFINCGTDYRVKILRTVPLYMPGYDATVYGKTIGYADCKQVANLSGVSGFVQVTNIDTTGLSAPYDLIKELNRVCQEGLIV